MSHKKYLSWFSEKYQEGNKIKELLLILKEKGVSTRDRVLVVKNSLNISLSEADKLVLDNSCTKEEYENILLLRNCLWDTIEKIK